MHSGPDPRLPVPQRPNSISPTSSKSGPAAVSREHVPVARPRDTPPTRLRSQPLHSPRELSTRLQALSLIRSEGVVPFQREYDRAHRAAHLPGLQTQMAIDRFAYEKRRLEHSRSGRLGRMRNPYEDNGTGIPYIVWPPRNALTLHGEDASTWETLMHQERLRSARQGEWDAYAASAKGRLESRKRVSQQFGGIGLIFYQAEKDRACRRPPKVRPTPRQNPSTFQSGARCDFATADFKARQGAELARLAQRRSRAGSYQGLTGQEAAATASRRARNFLTRSQSDVTHETFDDDRGHDFWRLGKPSFGTKNVKAQALWRAHTVGYANEVTPDNGASANVDQMRKEAQREGIKHEFFRPLNQL